MMKVKDKEFTPFISAEELDERINCIAKDISKDYRGRNPLVLGVLNGAFMFVSDLMKKVDIPLQMSFIKISSYQAMNSTGKVRELIGVSEEIKGREVIVVEDIVDTGVSMTHLLETISEKGPASISVVSLLFKPAALKKPVMLDYVGFEIPDKFVVGYGLDYDGFGRNLKEIYQLK
ncbi:hypoxanthine phosphoribosyltransferase [Echinicola marina]|uniref:hypoxanthine phosphoribosyltransferase n=1 Tax=Echinicola marina TaxID=2859768 RepID=UPI001CF669BC|nr:hypoxanthine phosphoribosyltransferase [Echinicola marina]UCS94076.1 hypoxanthine phosphoribosyltransferase [Echinicola marina]